MLSVCFSDCDLQGTDGSGSLGGLDVRRQIQLSYCRNRRKEASWPPDLSVPTQDLPSKNEEVGVQKNVFHLVRTLHVKLMCFRTVCQIPSDGFICYFYIWYIYIGWPSLQFKCICACSIILHSDCMYCYLMLTFNI